MTRTFSSFISAIGNRLQNFGYCLVNPSYLKVRSGKGCADIYRLLNKNWFPKEKIHLVLDVGANEGQFINTSLALMPDVPIYSFEPNPNLTNKLQSKYSSLNVKIFPIAIGEYQQKLSLNISEFSPSSSLLRGSEKLNSEFSETTLKEVVEVQVDRLDALIEQNGLKNILLKIDVQGFEMSVLKGAEKVLERVLVIVCEVSFASLYEQQCTFEEIASFLRKYNFDLIDIGDPIRSRHTQEVLYVDLAFVKR